MYKEIAANKRNSWILLLSFFVLIGILGYFISVYNNGNYGILAFSGVFAVVYGLIGYFAGDKIVLGISGAKRIYRDSNKDIYNVVENLCITAGIPVPNIYLIKDASPNAFATGRKPEKASIALTTGLIEKLDRTELEGVVSHELSHVKNYDIRYASLVVILVGFVQILTDIFLRTSLFWGGGGKKRNNAGGQIGALIMVVGLLLVVLSPIIAKLIQLAISRKREYLADASGALLTRYPEGLASALEKIANDPTPLKRVSNATSHLYIAPPRRKNQGFMNKLFATHPPAEDRIRKLRAMIANPS
ncbi:MAG: M48 family metallopeptidase [bacterium]